MTKPLRQGILEIMRAAPGQPKKVDELERRLGLSEWRIRNFISVLRRHDGHNIRNKNRVGFWLEKGPAPPLDDNPQTRIWQSEPPTPSVIASRCSGA